MPTTRDFDPLDISSHAINGIKRLPATSTPRAGEDA
jgi:hypothetical protein